MRTTIGQPRKVGKPQSRAFMVTLGLLGLIGASALLWVGINASKSVPGRGYYTVKAEFNEADNLADTYQLRIGADLVGQVRKTEARDGKAIVTLQFDKSEKPLLSDTRLEVRPRSPIGVRYVDVIPGTKGKPLGENALIPAAQTASTVPLDETLDALDAETRPEFRRFLSEFGEGFDTRGDDGNQTIAQAPRFLSDTQQVVGAITDLDGALGRFIASSQSAAAAADPVREDIGEGFEPEAQSLRPFKTEADAVRDTLKEAPPTLEAARVRLDQVEPFVRELGGFAKAATPTLRLGPGALSQTAGMLREGQPGLRELDRTIDLARRATSPVLNLLDAVQPSLPLLDRTLLSSLPIIRNLVPRACDYDRMWRNWASMLGFSDGTNAVLRYEVLSSAESFEGGLKNPAINPVRQNAYPEPCQAGREVPK